MTANEDRQKLLQALPAKDFDRQLRALVLQMAEEGVPKTEIVSLLENFLPTLPEEDDVRVDGVIDVLDGLTGWCHPDARLLPESAAEDHR